MNYSVLADFVGIVGVTLMLIAYYSLTTNRLTSLHLSYQLLNFFGSIFILYSLLFNWNLPSFVVEAAWLIISIVGIQRVYKHRADQLNKH